MTPTEEQIKEFWEWCGFSYGERTSLSGWLAPGAELPYYSKLPPLDLNNLLKWAVPKAHSKLGDEGLYDLMIMWVGDTIFGIDPALALFWVIYGLIGREDGS